MSAFSDALLECHDSVYRYARALCRDAIEAEELVQETFRRALAARRRPFPLTLESVRPWMFTILRNHWHNEIRQRRRDAEVEPSTELAAPDTPETIVCRRFLQSEVRDGLDALPPLFREAIVLRELEGLSYGEMAELLNCPPGTVMSRLARARALLRAMFAGLAPGRTKTNETHR